EEALQARGVEIDTARAGVLDPGGVGEPDLEERGGSGRLARHEEAGDTHHWLSVQSRVQLPSPCPLPRGERGWRREREMEISERSPASRVSGRSPIHRGARRRVASTSDAGVPSRCRSLRTIRVVGVPSTARWSRMYAEGGTGPSSSRPSTTRARRGQRGSRSAARSAPRRRPPQRTQSSAERSAPAAAVDAGSSASMPSTNATWPPPSPLPDVVIRAMRARSRLLAPEDRGPTISLSRPGGNMPSRLSIPSRSHPGGGEDAIGTPIAIDYTSLV